MKNILPSLREKKRYIVFEAIERKQNIEETIIESCLNFLGSYNYGRAGIQVLKELGRDRKGVIRVNNKYVDHIRAALMLNKKPVIKCIGVSGTIKKAKEKYLK